MSKPETFGGVTIIRPDLHDCATCGVAQKYDMALEVAADAVIEAKQLADEIAKLNAEAKACLEMQLETYERADKAEAEIAVLNRMVDVLASELHIRSDRFNYRQEWLDYARRQVEEDAG